MPSTMKKISILRGDGTYDTRDIGAEAQNVVVGKTDSGEIITDDTTPDFTESAAETLRELSDSVEDKAPIEHVSLEAGASDLGHVKVRPNTGLKMTEQAGISGVIACDFANNWNDDVEKPVSAKSMRNATMKPSSHAARDNQYGVGTDELYGHVKLTDVFNPDSPSAAVSGVAASQKAVKDAYTSLQTNFQAGVDTIYNAIVENGVTPSSSTPSGCATAINEIRKSGGDANSEEILEDKVAYVNGERVVGTMTNHSAYTNALSVAWNSGLYVRIPRGAYLQNTTAGSPEIMVASSNFGGANQSQVLKDATFTSSYGRNIKGTMQNYSGSNRRTISPSGGTGNQQLSLPPGYHDSVIVDRTSPYSAGIIAQYNKTWIENLIVSSPYSGSETNLQLDCKSIKDIKFSNTTTGAVKVYYICRDASQATTRTGSMSVNTIITLADNERNIQLKVNSSAAFSVVFTITRMCGDRLNPVL